MIERFQSKADGEIRPRGRNGSSKRGRGKASREIVSLSTVQRMRPERDEIIICTGVNRTTLGVQYWGEYAIWRHMLRRREFLVLLSEWADGIIFYRYVTA